MSRHAFSRGWLSVLSLTFQMALAAPDKKPALPEKIREQLSASVARIVFPEPFEQSHLPISSSGFLAERKGKRGLVFASANGHSISWLRERGKVQVVFRDGTPGRLVLDAEISAARSPVGWLALAVDGLEDGIEPIPIVECPPSKTIKEAFGLGYDSRPPPQGLNASGLKEAVQTIPLDISHIVGRQLEDEECPRLVRNLEKGWTGGIAVDRSGRMLGVLGESMIFRSELVEDFLLDRVAEISVRPDEEDDQKARIRIEARLADPAGIIEEMRASFAPDGGASRYPNDERRRTWRKPLHGRMEEAPLSISEGIAAGTVVLPESRSGAWVFQLKYRLQGRREAHWTVPRWFVRPEGFSRKRDASRLGPLQQCGALRTDVQMEWMDLSPDGRWLYALNRSGNELWRVSVPDLQIDRRLALSGKAMCASLSPLGKRLCIARWEEGANDKGGKGGKALMTLEEIDTATFEPAVSMEMEGMPCDLAVNDSGQAIVCFLKGSTRRCAVVDVRGKSFAYVDLRFSSAGNFRIHPVQWLAYGAGDSGYVRASFREQDKIRMEVNGKGMQMHAAEGYGRMSLARPMGLEISPDGKCAVGRYGHVLSLSPSSGGDLAVQHEIDPFDAASFGEDSEAFFTAAWDKTLKRYRMDQGGWSKQVFPLDCVFQRIRWDASRGILYALIFQGDRKVTEPIEKQPPAEIRAYRFGKYE